MTRKTIISLTAGFAFSGLTLYLALRQVPLIDLRAYFTRIDLRWTFLSGALAVPCFILRAHRWRMILESRMKMGFFQAFHPLMIGFMLNSTLPGRIGEVARPYILYKKEGLPFLTGLAAMALERLMDMGAIIFLSLMVLSTLDIKPDLVIAFGGYELSRGVLAKIGSGLIKICLAMLIFIFLILYPLTRSLIQRFILWIPDIIPFAPETAVCAMKEKIFKPMAGLIDLFAAGFILMKEPVKMIQCLFFTLMIWTGTALTFYVMAKGCPGLVLSFGQAIALMVIISLFIALPSAPGYWGLWEAGGIFGLSLFGIPADMAAGYTLVHHFIQLLPVIVIGLVSALITGVSVLQMSKIRPGGLNE